MYRLPRKVRRAISNITQVVSHQTLWGCYSHNFPNEQKWLVVGGYDWHTSLREVEVSVTSTYKRGVEVKGLDAVEAAYVLVKKERDRDFGDAYLQNQELALVEVLAVLKAATQM